MKLTEHQKSFLDCFGYLSFPGLFKDEISEIIDAFEAIFTENGGGDLHGRPHTGESRTCIIPFIDQSIYLSALMDDPRVNGLLMDLLGDDYTYTGSDGNYYAGDTAWHSDTDWSGVKRGKPPKTFYKIAFYLDPVDHDSGALRVIPGSHKYGDVYAENLEKIASTPEAVGCSGNEIPAVVLASNPGDMLIFNQNLKHSAWGGSKKRRMFTLNCCSRYTEDETQYLHNEIKQRARFWISDVYGPAMLETAGPERMRHLEQLLEHKQILEEAVEEAKEKMAEPSRG